jgi:hypothetical protein
VLPDTDRVVVHEPLEVHRAATAEVPVAVALHVVVDVHRDEIHPPVADPGDRAHVTHAPRMRLVDEVDLVIGDHVGDGGLGASAEQVLVEPRGGFPALAPAPVVDLLIEQLGDGLEVAAVGSEGVARSELADLLAVEELGELAFAVHGRSVSPPLVS